MDRNPYGAGLSILVVDDQREFRIAMQQMLDSLGFNTILAADGAEALTALSKQTVALMITDLYMPHVDGLELMRRLRLHVDPVPPIIAVTGNNSITGFAVGNVAGALGARSVLVKPFSLDQLTAAIGLALSERP